MKTLSKSVLRKAVAVATVPMLGTMFGFPASTAHAAPISTVQSSWEAGTPGSLPNGEKASLSFQINANDSLGAKGTWKDLTATVTLGNASWVAMPKMCAGPGSAISADRKVLTCNVGDTAYGTAVTVDGDIMAQGADGDKISVNVKGPQSEVNLPQLSVVATTGIDVVANGSVQGWTGWDELNYPENIPVGISLPVGAENIKDHVEFDIDMSNGTANNGVAATDILQPAGCSDRTDISSNIPDTANGMPPKPTTCTITQVSSGNGVNTYHVVLDGFRTNYTPQPSKGSDGSKLPTDRVWVTGADLVFKNTAPMFKNGYGDFISIFDVKNVKAQTLSGKDAPETTPDNQHSSFHAYAGTASANWYRRDPESPVVNTAPWSGHDYVVAGDRLDAFEGQTATNGSSGGPSSIWGVCTIIDPNTVAFDGKFNQFLANGAPVHVQYSTDTTPDLNNFACDDTHNWSDQPADISKVTAIRMTWDRSQQDPNKFNEGVAIIASTTVKPNPAGTDIWMAGSLLRGDNQWTLPANDIPFDFVTGGKYQKTTNFRDLVWIANYRAVANKTVDKPVIKVNDEATYTLHGSLASYQGKGGAGTIDMVDTLPPGLEFEANTASVAPTSVTTDGNGYTTVQWNNIAVQSNTDHVITYKAKAHNADTLKNTLTVNNSTPGTPADDAHKSATSDATVDVIQQGETVLTKAVASQQFAVDGTNIWNLDLENKDSRVQNTTDVIDILPWNGDPNGSKFVGTQSIDDVQVGSVSNVKVYYTTADPKSLNYDPADASNGSMGNPSSIWTTDKPDHPTAVRVIGNNLAPAAHETIALTWSTQQASDKNVYTNIAGSRATTTKLQMVKAAASTVLEEASQLQIDKAKETTSPLRDGKTVVYDIVVKNNGKGVAHDVVAKDTPGVGLDPASAVMSDAEVGTVKGDTWTIGNLNPGQVVHAKVTVAVLPDADLSKDVTNYATVGNPSNPTPGDLTKCVPNVGVQSDTDQCDVTSDREHSHLRIDKQVVSQNLVVGGTVDYKIVVGNDGPDTAYDVVVNDIPGAGLDPASAKTWKIDHLDPGQTAEFTTSDVVKEIVPGQDVVNRAETHNPGNHGGGTCLQNDSLATDTDMCDSTNTQEHSNLKVHKEVVDENLVPGGFVDYKITVLNEGPDAASAVVVKDIPGAGLDANAAKNWTIDKLEAGKSQTFTIKVPVVTVAPGQDIVNTTTVENPSHPVPNDPNKSCKANDTVESDNDQCDIAKTKEDSILKVHKEIVSQNLTDGGFVEYKITVLNAGKTAAYGVVVKDIPGAGLDTSAAKDWKIDKLDAGQTADFTVKVPVTKVEAGKDVVNNATVQNPSHPVPGDIIEKCVQNNNVQDDSDQCDVAKTKDDVKLQVHKEVVKSNMVAGGSVTYKITVLNSGTTDAYNVTVKDIPGAGLDTKAAKDWKIDKLEAGKTAEFTVEVPLAGNFAPNMNVENKATVENPNHPVDAQKCEPNKDVASDTDQCDLVKNTTPAASPSPSAPANPTNPAAANPTNPAAPAKPGIATGGNPANNAAWVAGIAGVVVAGAAGTTLLIRRRKNS